MLLNVVAESDHATGYLSVAINKFQPFSKDSKIMFCHQYAEGSGSVQK
jgi:hypothetical protein